MHCLNTLFAKLSINQSIIFCNSGAVGSAVGGGGGWWRLPAVYAASPPTAGA